MLLSIEQIRSRIHPVCKKYDVKAAYLFGSYARGEATESSDVDIRIEKGLNNRLRGLLQINMCQDELETALQKPVDLLTVLPDSKTNSIFLNLMKKDEVLLYENQP